MKKSIILLALALVFATAAFAGEKTAAQKCGKKLCNSRYSCLTAEERQLVKYSCGQKMFGKGTARGLFTILQCPAEIFRSNTYYITRFYRKGKTFGTCCLPLAIVIGSADGLFGLVNRTMTGFWDVAMLGYYDDYDSLHTPFIWESAWCCKTWQNRQKLEAKVRLTKQREALLTLMDVNRKLRLENQKAIDKMLKENKAACTKDGGKAAKTVKK